MVRSGGSHLVRFVAASGEHLAQLIPYLVSADGSNPVDRGAMQLHRSRIRDRSVKKRHQIVHAIFASYLGESLRGVPRNGPILVFAGATECRYRRFRFELAQHECGRFPRSSVAPFEHGLQTRDQRLADLRYSGDDLLLSFRTALRQSLREQRDNSRSVHLAQRVRGGGTHPRVSVGESAEHRRCSRLVSYVAKRPDRVYANRRVRAVAGPDQVRQRTLADVGEDFHSFILHLFARQRADEQLRCLRSWR